MHPVKDVNSKKHHHRPTLGSKAAPLLQKPGGAEVGKTCESSQIIREPALHRTRSLGVRQLILLSWRLVWVNLLSVRFPEAVVVARCGPVSSATPHGLRTQVPP
jgi:hypothetical protein